MINLKHLILFDNQFIGEIPIEIGNLIHLTSLYLSDNQLTGEIPSIIVNSLLSPFSTQSLCNINAQLW